MGTHTKSRGRRQGLLLLAIALASCNPLDGANPESSQPMPQSRDKKPISRSQADASLAPMVDSARADLAERLRLASEESMDIKVLRAERVTWRSAALGCPKPDRGYKMVLTPGVLIVLRAGEENYEYHGRLTGPPFLCEPPGRIETPAPGNHSLDPT